MDIDRQPLMEYVEKHRGMELPKPEATFSRLFFRWYDKKISSGEITFFETGIRKNDFTNICTDGSYVFPRDEVEKICFTMKLTPEEADLLMAAAGYSLENDRDLAMRFLHGQGADYLQSKDLVEELFPRED